jgi:hypothetical protein
LEVSKSNRSLKVRCFVSWLIWRISPDELGTEALPSRAGTGVTTNLSHFHLEDTNCHTLEGFQLGGQGTGDLGTQSSWTTTSAQVTKTYFESLPRTCSV